MVMGLSDILMAALVHSFDSSGAAVASAARAARLLALVSWNRVFCNYESLINR